MRLEELVKRIAREKGIEVKDVFRLIKDKVEELGGLIDEEAAALIVAKELGVEVPNKKVVLGRLRIADLVEGLKSVEILGRILRVDPPVSFMTKKGRSKVASIIMGDESGEIKVVLWEPYTELIESLKLKVGDAIKIRGGVVRRFGERLEVKIGRGGGLDVLKRIDDIPPVEEILRRRGEVPPKDATLKVSAVYGPVYYGPRRKVGCIEGVDEEGDLLRVILWGKKSHWAKLVREGDVILIKGLTLRQEGRVTEYVLHKWSSISLMKRGQVFEKEVLEPSSLKEEGGSYRIRGCLVYLGPHGMNDLTVYLGDAQKVVKVYVSQKFIKRALFKGNYLNKVITLEGLERLEKSTFRTFPWSYMSLTDVKPLSGAKKWYDVRVKEVKLRTGIYCDRCLREVRGGGHECFKEGVGIHVLHEILCRTAEGIDVIIVYPWRILEEVADINEERFKAAFKEGEDLTPVLTYQLEKLAGEEMLMKGRELILGEEGRLLFAEEVKLNG